MLDRPDISDDRILACLRNQYGLHARQITFLPIGNDVNTAAFQVVSDDTTSNFLKLRRGPFAPATVIIPTFLHDHGVSQVIPALRTTKGQLWTRLEPFAVMLFPFVVGRNGFASPLAERQWIELGKALRSLHAAAIPTELTLGIPREDYDPVWRNIVRALQASVDEAVFTDAIAAELAAFLRAKREVITHLVDRAEALGQALRDRSPDIVLCHADIHAANVLLDENGALFLVDWDTLIFAPKERDLMFIGGGIGGAWNDPNEADLFFRGYGQTTINPAALAYYRYERIVEDIAEYGERLLRTDLGAADRVVGLQKFVGGFQPGNVVDIACRVDEPG